MKNKMRTISEEGNKSVEKDIFMSIFTECINGCKTMMSFWLFIKVKIEIFNMNKFVNASQ